MTTESGVLERTYVDPERDCDKRRRFVAEFIAAHPEYADLIDAEHPGLPRRR